MENISISSYSAQLRIYSGAAGPPKSKSANTSSESSSDTSSGLANLSCDYKQGEVAKSKDGDSFSMSLEARIVQISMTRSDGNQDWSGQNADATSGVGSQNASGQADNAQSAGSLGSGLLKAMLQAVGLMGKDAGSATDAQTSGQTAGQTAGQGSSDANAVQGNGSKHHHHHRHMGNPEDVASKVLQNLQQEHAAKGGNLQAFVDQIQQRMENRKDAGNGKSDGSSDFRNQVDDLITSGLTAWAQTGGKPLNVQA